VISLTDHQLQTVPIIVTLYQGMPGASGVIRLRYIDGRQPHVLDAGQGLQPWPLAS
jgi:hypothetical protein